MTDIDVGFYDDAARQAVGSFAKTLPVGTTGVELAMALASLIRVSAECVAEFTTRKFSAEVLRATALDVQEQAEASK